MVLSGGVFVGICVVLTVVAGYLGVLWGVLWGVWCGVLRVSCVCLEFPPSKMYPHILISLLIRMVGVHLFYCLCVFPSPCPYRPSTLKMFLSSFLALSLLLTLPHESLSRSVSFFVCTLSLSLSLSPFSLYIPIYLYISISISISKSKSIYTYIYTYICTNV